MEDTVVAYQAATAPMPSLLINPQFTHASDSEEPLEMNCDWSKLVISSLCRLGD